MKIYTRTGDDGTTGLLGGSRTHKSSPRIQAIGDVDELNAAIGLVRVVLAEPMLEAIQCWLFDLGAELACPPDGKFEGRGPSRAAIEKLERSIDSMEAGLEPLKNFILPGGCEAAARLHLARAVCRRAERSVLAMGAGSASSSESCVFLNRLSDWLFVAARAANAQAGVEDVAWRKSEEH